MQLNYRKILLGVAVLVIALVGFSFLKSILFPPVRSVTTSGLGRKAVDANRAVLIFTVNVSNVDKAVATSEGESKVSDVLKALTQYGPTEIRKSAYQVVPQGLGINTQRAYSFSGSVQLTLDGKENISGAIAALKEQGVPLSQLLYRSSDESGAGEEARKMAIEEAKAKAEQIAKASRSRLGKVLVVSEQASNDLSGTSVTTSASADDTSFSQIEVQSALNVTFELK